MNTGLSDPESEMCYQYAMVIGYFDRYEIFGESLLRKLRKYLCEGSDCEIRAYVNKDRFKWHIVCYSKIPISNHFRQRLWNIAAGIRLTIESL